MPPVAAKPRLGIRGYVAFGGTTLAAKETFEAVADNRGSAIVGGAQVTNIWKNVFADIGGSQLSLDGERVFVLNGRIFELGIPLDVTLRTFDVAGGWRFSYLRGRVFPYAGAGFSHLHYEEKSEFAQSGEDVTDGSVGPLLLVGADVRVWRWIGAGGELRWRRIRGILGEGGVSKEFGEDDAGGVSAGVRISIGR